MEICCTIRSCSVLGRLPGQKASLDVVLATAHCFCKYIDELMFFSHDIDLLHLLHHGNRYALKCENKS